MNKNNDMYVNKLTNEKTEILKKMFASKTDYKESDIMGVIEVDDQEIVFCTTDFLSYLYNAEDKTITSLKDKPKKHAGIQILLTPDEKEQYFKDNEGLIYFALKKIDRPSVIEFEELEGYAKLGFVKALNTYDRFNGAKFSTYAVKCMVNELYYFLRKAYKYINDQHMEDPLSGDADGQLTLADTISANELCYGRRQELTPEEAAELTELQRLIRDALSELDDDEQYLITYRYGLEGGKVLTQNEIAAVLGMSQANISKLEKHILAKMKLYLTKRGYIYNPSEHTIGSSLENVNPNSYIFNKLDNLLEPSNKFTISIRVAELLCLEITDVADVIPTNAKDWFHIVLKDTNMYHLLYNNISDRIEFVNEKLSRRDRFISLIYQRFQKSYYTVNDLDDMQWIPKYSNSQFSRLMKNISEEQKKIISYFHGFSVNETMSFAQIAKKMDMDIDDAQRLYKEAIRTLTEYVKYKPVKKTENENQIEIITQNSEG